VRRVQRLEIVSALLQERTQRRNGIIARRALGDVREEGCEIFSLPAQDERVDRGEVQRRTLLRLRRRQQRFEQRRVGRSGARKPLVQR